jgi:hypothetical protein
MTQMVAASDDPRKQICTGVLQIFLSCRAVWFPRMKVS